MLGISGTVRRLRRAIDHGQLRMEYQPMADMRTGRVIGVEALARWHTPRRGVVRPDDFIPRAERSAKTLELLTDYTLEVAAQQARQWQLEGHELTVAVNLSPRSVLDSVLVDKVAGVLSRYGLAANLIELELTETAVFGIADPQTVATTLRGLADLGLVLALDDFGTGYSSLTRLRDLPIHQIKIDKSFVLRMDERPNDALIVRSVIALAKSLGVRVIAEGVERDTVWRRLSELGCDVAQGNYLTPSRTPEELILWVRQWEELYEEAHRLADELLERRQGPSDRRSGIGDRRTDGERRLAGSRRGWAD